MSHFLVDHGGATAEAAVPEWAGYRCVCLPRSRASFCDLRQGVWSVRIEPRMLEVAIVEVASREIAFSADARGAGQERIRISRERAAGNACGQRERQARQDQWPRMPAHLS